MTYNPAMDGLRAVAIALVLLFHAGVPGFRGGSLGVDLFFVLSGFLITSLLAGEAAATGRIQFGRFYFRRLMRLTPALLGLLAAYLIAAPMLWPEAANPFLQAALAAAYLSDYAMAFWQMPNELRHTWSLAIEEHFYLLWPLVIVAGHRLRKRQFLLILFGAYLAAVTWRWASIQYGQSWEQVYYRFDTHFSGLLLGACLALAMQEARGRLRLEGLAKWSIWLPLMLIGILQLRWADERFLTTGIFVTEWATVVLLIAVCRRHGVIYEVLSVAPLVWLGRLSYSLYLWHFPVFMFIRDYLAWHEVMAIGGSLSLALAALSYYTVERWGRRFRDRL